MGFAAAAPLAMTAAQGLMSSKGGGGGGGGKKDRPQSPQPQLLAQALPFLNTGSQMFQQFAPLAMQGLQTGMGSLTQAAQGTMLPGLMSQIESELLPALERSFGRGEAAIRESAANAGTLRSSSTTGEASDLRTGLESALLQQLAGIRGQLGQQDIMARLTAGQTLAGLPLQGLQAGGGFIGGLPFAQPQFGPSGKEQFGGFAAPILGGLAGNPSLFAKKQ